MARLKKNSQSFNKVNFITIPFSATTAIFLGLVNTRGNRSVLGRIAFIAIRPTVCTLRLVRCYLHCLHCCWIQLRVNWWVWGVGGGSADKTARKYASIFSNKMWKRDWFEFISQEYLSTWFLGGECHIWPASLCPKAWWVSFLYCLRLDFWSAWIVSNCLVNLK